jgi:hypothetical protein
MVRSLPPEYVAATARLQQEAKARDPMTILSQEANRAEIEEIGSGEWLTLYAFQANKDGSRYYFCALTPKEHIDEVMAHESSDLMIGGGLPGFTQSYVSGKAITRYDRFSSGPIEPLIYARDFYGLKPRQFDILEEFRHFHDLYHDRRNDRYIQVDARGEDIVVVEVAPNEVRAKTRHVRQFLATRQLHLIVFFDHRAEVPTANVTDVLRNEKVHRSDLRFLFHAGKLELSEGRTFSRLLGKKLIAPLPVEECGVWPYETRRQFTDYIIGVDANGQNVVHTSDEEELANYFGKNPGAPHFLTPVWFRREVLRKYYDHPDKFSVEDGYLRCGGLWGLQMDNDLPDHVVVFLGDLGTLAYEEQLYWKSFNIPPAAAQSSETHYRRSYLAEFADPTTPELVLKQKLVGLQEAWEQRYGWKLFRQLHDDDAHVVKQLRAPLTESMGEFDHQSLLLAKLLIDSLDDTHLTQELGSALPDEKSIGKLGRFLELKGYPYRDRDSKLLRLLQAVRSTSAAHGKGDNFRKISDELRLSEKPPSEVFRELLTRVNEMLTDLQAHFFPVLEG